MDYIIAALLLLALIFLVSKLNQANQVNHAGQAIVNDGDSLTINGRRIRLWGIDAPELSQICNQNSGTYPCGRSARDALQAMVRGKQVDCRGNEQDKYGRLLAICSAGAVELNETLVAAGWALAYGGYEMREAEARRAQKGIWSGEFERPQDWRRDGGHQSKPTDDYLAAAGDIIRKWFSSVFGGE